MGADEAAPFSMTLATRIMILVVSSEQTLHKQHERKPFDDFLFYFVDCDTDDSAQDCFASVS